MSILQQFFQSLQGTVWQGRLLFLQQNTDTYRWVFVGVFIFVYILYSTIFTVICRKHGSNVCISGYIPVVNILLIPILAVKAIFIGGIKYVKSKKPVKSKGKGDVGLDEELDLFSGSSESSESEDGIDNIF